MTLSADFNQDYVLDTESNVLKFEIVDDVELKVKKASYPYIVRISEITESEDVIWEDGGYTFTVRCGAPSFKAPSA